MSYIRPGEELGYLEKIDEDTYVIRKNQALYNLLYEFESIEPFKLEDSENESKETEFNNSTPSTEIKLKICESCGEELPFEEFYKNKAEKDGFHKKCKLCLKQDAAYKGIKELKKLVTLTLHLIKIQS